MNVGKQTRMNRLFSHPSGRFLSIAVDHFIGYGQGLPDGLRHIQPTLAAIVAGCPDAVTMHQGIARTAWGCHAGRVPMILQAIAGRSDDSAFEQFATPEDAVCLGADAFAVAVFVRGATEAQYLRVLADAVRNAARFDMPVICHIYPRNADRTISYAPEDIAWAVRCAVEAGADVVKTPYCGDVNAFHEIVCDCPVPLIAAGGPKSDSLYSALEMIADVVASGARGATIGRNVWGFDRITDAVRAFKAVVHDRLSPQEALESVGLA